MKYLCILGVLCLAVTPAIAEDDGVYRSAGTSTAQFLKIPVGARYRAMGNAYAAFADDAHGLYGQPAAASLAQQSSISATHNEWLEDIRHEYVGVVYKLDEMSAVSGHFTYLGVGSIDRTDEDAAGNLATRGGTFDAYDYELSLGYADCWTPALRYGGMLKFVRSEIDDVNASAMAFDGGLVYLVDKRLRVGVSMTNLGSEMKFITTGNRLPLTWRLGASYDLPLAPELNLLLAGDAIKPNDARWGGRFGMELYGRRWALRAGYRTGDALDNGFSCGAGVKLFGSLQFDYAWAPGGVLGNTQFFSVGYLF